MENKGLTLSVIFEAESANYGQGYGNISTIKKMSRIGGNAYTYISRQAMIFSLKQQLGWLKTPTEVQGKVAQYAPGAKIDEYEEIDLFGYFKTTTSESKKTKEDKENKEEKIKKVKGTQKTRPAVARFSNAISLEPYRGDMDFGTNISLANREKDKKGLLPYNTETHKSYYTYTVTVDLDKVGEDKEDDIYLDKKEKANRIVKLLGGIEFLNREIKGRSENMNPIFIVGGVYNIKNPFFENRLELEEKRKLNIGEIKYVLNSIEKRVIGTTYIGCIKEKFDNGEDLEKELKTIHISEVFEHLCEEIQNYYGK